MCNILHKKELSQITVRRLVFSILVFVLFFSISSCGILDNDTPGFSAKSDNDAIGLPAKNEADFQIVNRLGFCLGYSEEHEQAAWVCYKLTKNEILNSNVKRTNDFRPDPEIKTKSSELVDYKGSGYDRGHLAPAGDMGWSLDSMSQSFLLSNISPQQPGFNQGIWRNLEELVRSWSIQNEEVFVVTGPLLTEDLQSIGPNAVSVPDFFYKIVLDYYDPEKKGIAFLLPNRPLENPLSEYVKSIDDIELITGLDFFPKIPDSEEEKLESLAEYDLWSAVSSAKRVFVKAESQSQQPPKVDQKDEYEKQNATNVYWITNSSGIRHNASCRWYKTSKGHLGPKTEGRACRLCGG